MKDQRPMRDNKLKLNSTDGCTHELEYGEIREVKEGRGGAWVMRIGAVRRKPKEAQCHI